MELAPFVGVPISLRLLCRIPYQIKEGSISLRAQSELAEKNLGVLVLRFYNLPEKAWLDKANSIDRETRIVRYRELNDLTFFKLRLL